MPQSPPKPPRARHRHSDTDARAQAQSVSGGSEHKETTGGSRAVGGASGQGDVFFPTAAEKSDGGTRSPVSKMEGGAGEDTTKQRAGIVKETAKITIDLQLINPSLDPAGERGGGGGGEGGGGGWGGGGWGTGIPLAEDSVTSAGVSVQGAFRVGKAATLVKLPVSPAALPSASSSTSLPVAATANLATNIATTNTTFNPSANVQANSSGRNSQNSALQSLYAVHLLAS